MSEHADAGGPLRHRVIPGRGRARSWFTYSAADARQEAEAYAVEHEMPVLVCEAPAGGLIRQLYTIKPPAKAAKR